WGSHCDLFAFHGWMMSFDKTRLAPTGVYVTTANGEDGGFWAGGSGPAVDSSGAIYFGSGNGDFTGNDDGTDFGDSILRLNWSNNTFTLVDYFTPWDYESLDQNDPDLVPVVCCCCQTSLVHPTRTCWCKLGKRAPSILSSETTWATGILETTAKSCKPSRRLSEEYGALLHSGTT